jgi:hypothetical protein
VTRGWTARRQRGQQGQADSPRSISFKLPDAASRPVWATKTRLTVISAERGASGGLVWIQEAAARVMAAAAAAV